MPADEVPNMLEGVIDQGAAAQEPERGVARGKSRAGRHVEMHPDAMALRRFP